MSPHIHDSNELATRVRQRIESITAEMGQRNQLALKARQGTLTQEQVRTYLSNLFYAFSNTPRHLNFAATRADELGMGEVGEFMRSRIAEELGHEEWARNDLRKQKLGEPEAGAVLPEMRSLMSDLDSVIERDPRLYVAYMAFAEYFTVLAAPEFLRDVENNCGIKADALTAITNHAELDKDHIEEDLEAIAGLVPASLESEFLALIDSSGARIDGILSKCAQA